MANRMRQKWQYASAEPRSEGLAYFFLSLCTSDIAMGSTGLGQPAEPKKRMRDMQSINAPTESLPSNKKLW